ncbi:hypothetical protein BDF14DRAFT_1779537 [Spinellus fusiger]|nr:hypothetical protein BDF14DRAFT_1779537 [Spinellus fusiger]
MQEILEDKGSLNTIIQELSNRLQSLEAKLDAAKPKDYMAKVGAYVLEILQRTNAALSEEEWEFFDDWNKYSYEQAQEIRQAPQCVRGNMRTVANMAKVIRNNTSILKTTGLSQDRSPRPTCRSCSKKGHHISECFKMVKAKGNDVSTKKTLLIDFYRVVINQD